MKKYLVLLLIGLMFLGLTLSVLAAEPDATRIKGRDLNLAIAGDHNRTVITFARRLLGGACGLLMAYTQLGFAFSGTNSRTRNAGHIMAVNILVYSIGMLGYQGWLLLTRFLIPKREPKEEVCYGW